MNPKLLLKVFSLMLLTIVQVVGTGRVARSASENVTQKSLENQGVVCISIATLADSQLVSPRQVDTIPQVVSTADLLKVVQALRDPTNKDICGMASQLEKVGQPAVLMVIPLLNDQEPMIRLRAVMALGMMRKSAKSAIPALLPLLKDPESVIRSRTIDTLSRIGMSSNVSISSLVPLLKDSNVKIRLEAAQTLFELDGESSQLAVPTLLSLLKDSNKSIQRAATATFMLMPERSKSVIPLLTPLLKDPDPEVRSRIEELITHITTATKLLPPKPLLPEVIKSDTKKTEVTVQQPANQSQTINQLIQQLKSGDVLTRSSAAKALGKMGESAIPNLIPLLKDSDADVRSSAAKALGNMGESAKSAIPSLIPLLNGSNSWVRSSATEALKKLGYQL